MTTEFSRILAISVYQFPFASSCLCRATCPFENNCFAPETSYIGSLVYWSHLEVYLLYITGELRWKVWHGHGHARLVIHRLGYNSWGWKSTTDKVGFTLYSVSLLIYFNVSHFLRFRAGSHISDGRFKVFSLSLCTGVNSQKLSLPLFGPLKSIFYTW